MKAASLSMAKLNKNDIAILTYLSSMVLQGLSENLCPIP
jgi:hypothetical protein